MTRAEAEDRVRELAEEQPDHGFFARERDGKWEVVKLPGAGTRRDPTVTSTEARPRPEPDDTRPSHVRSGLVGY
jgi:hypothetical protein